MSIFVNLYLHWYLGLAIHRLHTYVYIDIYIHVYDIYIYIYISICIYKYIHIMDNMYMRPPVFVCFLRHSSRLQKNDRHLIGDFLELFGQLWILSAKLPCEAAFHAMPRHRLANLLLKKTAHEINCKIYVKKLECRGVNESWEK